MKLSLPFAAWVLFTLVALLFAPESSGQQTGGVENVLIITADDLGYESLGVTGLPVGGISPNIDRLASEGILMKRAYVTVAVCQPCRQVWFTGRYPHRLGTPGFNPIAPDVPTLTQQTRKAGFLNGILGKSEHLQPQSQFAWDVMLPSSYSRNGRDPKVHFRHALRFFQRAKKEGKRFLLMANTTDPHRPFPGALREKQSEETWGFRMPPINKAYTAEQVRVPGFLPDLPGVRNELATYYTSVHRCDEVVGEVLRALQESGMADKTLVMFLSDHGMAFPFGKSNCYRHSTRTPWIIRWPGAIKPGSVDSTHFVSGIDLTPTVLDALQLPVLKGVDGRSFVPILQGRPMTERDHVITVYQRSPGNRDYPMRCIENERYGYIFNAWADGKTLYSNSAQGKTMAAMIQVGRSNESVAARVRLFKARVPEEFYDYQEDPHARRNLANDPGLRAKMQAMRAQLMEEMRDQGDPLLKKMTIALKSAPPVFDPKAKLELPLKQLPYELFNSPYLVQKWKSDLRHPVRKDQLKSMTTLGFSDPAQVTDGSLPILADLPQLEFVDLSRCPITDAGLVYLKDLRKLEMLYLIETAIGDKGMSSLENLTALRWLNLSGTKISGQGLTYLGNLDQLEVLYLNDTRIGDSDLIHLEALTNLDVIQLGNTQVTSAGVERLQKALPETSIYID